MPIVAAAIICVVKWVCRVFIVLSEAFVPLVICLITKAGVKGEISMVLHNVM